MDFIASAPAAILLTVVGLSGALYYIAKIAYPQPLPGIPYDKIAASRLLGDIPTARKAVKETGDAMEFFTQKAEDLQSPIFQFFFLPFTKPKVVIADYRESRDIMVHRIKEFDRSDALIDFFQPLVRTSQLISKTDETWTYHRRLVQDTMSPSFLRNVAAPNMYDAFARLLDLWQRKVVLAGGRPFAVADDLSAATFDGVLAFTFGSDFRHTAMEPLMKALDKADSAALTYGLGMDEEVDFPAEKMHDDVSCFHTLMAQMERVAKIPVVKLAWLMVGNTREFRRQQQHKSVVIQRQIDEAVVSMGTHTAVDNGDWVKHAVDHVVDRECRIAAKEGRQPNYNAPELADELFTFIVAGHDTTATATAWAVKILTKYPGVQTKLRTALYETHADAKAEGRRPTAKELTDGTPSYMEAFMAELFRYQSPTPVLGRTATCDSVVLGHRIPKGTNVTFLVRGPSIHMPAFAIDESVRTATAVRDAMEHPLLESNEMDEFRPERWYVAKEGSAERLFDGSKWPNATFGMGKRGCFGKRLAHLEFRMILTMILWEFELLPCPVALSSWAGQPKIAYRPKQCYVRMKAVLGAGDRL